MAGEVKGPQGIASGLGLPRVKPVEVPVVTVPDYAPSFAGTVDLLAHRDEPAVTSIATVALAGRVRLRGLVGLLGWRADDALVTEQLMMRPLGGAHALLLRKTRRRTLASARIDEEQRVVLSADDRRHLGIGRGSETLLAAVHQDDGAACLLLPMNVINRTLEASWPD